jgi:hypothetical protein
MRGKVPVICPTAQARSHATCWHDGQFAHGWCAGREGCTISVSSADRPLLHRRRNPARWNRFGEQGAFLRRRDGKRIRHCEERKRRSKSIVSLRGGMDCFAGLAMTRSESVPTSGKRLVRSLPSLRHSAVIARSAATKQSIFLCCAPMHCFTKPVIGRAFARPGGSDDHRGAIEDAAATLSGASSTPILDRWPAFALSSSLLHQIHQSRRCSRC